MSKAIQCPFCRAWVYGAKHECPKKPGQTFTHDDLEQIVAGETNEDGTYKPWKAAQAVARLKTLILPPYRIKGHLESGRLKSKASKEEFFRQFRAVPPDIAGQSFQTLSEILAVIRTLYPEGDWLILLSGTVPEGVIYYKHPLAFIDTPCIEKAITWHTEQGHEGVI